MKDRDHNELAEYNSRISKGILHNKEYMIKMKKLQEEFNKEVKNIGIIGAGDKI